MYNCSALCVQCLPFIFIFSVSYVIVLVYILWRTNNHLLTIAIRDTIVILSMHLSNGLHVMVNQVPCVAAILQCDVAHSTRNSLLLITSPSFNEAEMLLYGDFPVHMLDHLKFADYRCHR